MSKVTIEIDTSGSAFDYNFHGELRDITLDAVDKVSLMFEEGKAKLLDSNGNTCGFVQIEEN